MTVEATGVREILVDSNVILDVATEDPRWIEWSAGQLGTLAEDHILVINPIIYGEGLCGVRPNRGSGGCPASGALPT